MGQVDDNNYVNDHLYPKNYVLLEKEYIFMQNIAKLFFFLNFYEKALKTNCNLKFCIESLPSFINQIPKFQHFWNEFI